MSTWDTCATVSSYTKLRHGIKTLLSLYAKGLNSSLNISVLSANLLEVHSSPGFEISGSRAFFISSLCKSGGKALTFPIWCCN